MGWLLWTGLGQPDLAAPLPAPSATQSPGSIPPAASPTLTAAERLDSLKVLLAVVGGLAAVVALTVAYRKQRHGENAELREDIKLFTDRFGSAAGQLGDDNSAVRLAGVYALTRLADDADAETDWQARQMCIDVLCAYLRMPYTPPQPAPRRSARRQLAAQRALARGDAEAATARDPHEEQQVRATVIRVMAAHLHRDAAVSWSGHDFDVTGAVLDTDADFTGATFAGGRVSFSRATFSGGVVSFGVATFSGGHVSFSGATFSGGVVSFDEATFSDGDVSFTGATFLDCRVLFSGATFVGHAQVSFGGATFLGGAKVYFRQATFAGGEVSFNGGTVTSGAEVSFAGATFSGGLVLFNHAAVGGAEVSFSGATFCGGGVYFGGATFSGGHVSFSGATFFGGRVHLTGVTFSGGEVSFNGATVSSGADVSFGGAKFSGGAVSFAGAAFSGGAVYLGGATFSGGAVSFAGATFSGGAVDLSKPWVWMVPPVFDRLDPVPAGLDLPAGFFPQKPEKTSESSPS